MKKIVFILSILNITFAYNGSITGLTYFDFSRGYGESSFNFNRQYFNYAIHMSNDMKFKVVFDVGRTDSGTILTDDNLEKSEDARLLVFLKKAQLDYKCDWGTTSLGLIGTNSYGIQEKNWGYRFIEKSAIDKNGFSSTADLGIGFSREIKDNLNFSIQLINGEGYKRPQSDKYEKLSINTTYGERNLPQKEGFNIGITFTSENTTSMLSMFGGFSFNGFRVGAESDFLTENNILQNLTSLTSAYIINNKIDAFARYDVLENDGDEFKYFISGFVYDCGSGLLVSPNVRTTHYAADEFVYSLNFQFTF